MSTSPWLDETEAAAWRGLWAMSHLLFERIERALQAHSGLSLFEYDVLVRLSAAPDGRVRLSALAEQLLSSRARLSYRIKRMVADGVVRREECETDRRGAFAVLTERGRRLLEEAAPRHVADVRTYLINALEPGQLEALGEIADKVEEHLSALDGAHSPNAAAEDSSAS